MDATRVMFKKSSLDQKRALLRTKGYRLPSRDSTAGCSESFLLRAFEGTITLISDDTISECPYQFDLDVGFTPQALIARIAIEASIMIQGLDYIYGVSFECMADYEYLLYLLYQINPKSLPVLMYSRFKKNSSKMIVEDQNVDLALLYTTQGLRKKNFKPTMNPEETEMIDFMNKAGQVVYMYEFEFPKIGKLIGQMGKDIAKFKDLQVYHKKVLKNVIGVAMPFYEAYKKRMQANVEKTGNELSKMA